MHSECEGEVVLGLAVLGVFEVIPQHLAVLRSDAVVDDLFSALTRALTTQIGYTLFGNKHFDTVLGVIEVRHHRYDGRDSAVLRRRSGGEDRQVRVTGKIA